jgi:hypothetical protein
MEVGEMTITMIIQKVLEDGVQLVRAKKVEKVKGEPWQYDIKDAFTGKKKSWFYFDSFTASAMLAVYNALSEENKAKFDLIPLPKLVDFTWKHVK